MTTAPVCPISRNQPIAAMAAPRLPAIPLAVDLSSLIQAVNDLRLALQSLGPGLLGLPIPAPAKPIVYAYEDWFEVTRETQNKRIYQKDEKTGVVDESSFVDVVRINKIIFRYQHNDPYGARFTWSYFK